jgi:nucleoside-diphosphate-sugar epimerase
MHIAILGATSQIARDFVMLAAKSGIYRFSLYARRPQVVQHWVKTHGLLNITHVGGLCEFGRDIQCDALINFVGVGDPAAAQAMGASILDVTRNFDELALNYVIAQPRTRYIFISSGAVYGSDFAQAVTEQSPTIFDINRLQLQDWYGISKFYAECRHRALVGLPIVDIRVFSYFSRSQDLSARFFATDVVRAVRDKIVIKTSSDHIVRDFLHPSDFFHLIQSILTAPVINQAVDCYTRCPVDKPTLLSAMEERFGLNYEIIDDLVGVNATGFKANYYSLNKRAADFGYQPSSTALESFLTEASAVLTGNL